MKGRDFRLWRHLEVGAPREANPSMGPDINSVFGRSRARRIFDEFTDDLADELPDELAVESPFETTGGVPGVRRILELAIGPQAVAAGAVREAGRRRDIEFQVETIDLGPHRLERSESGQIEKVYQTPPVLADRSIDGLVSFYGFEHFAPKPALSWLRRTLRRGGRVSCVTLAAGSPCLVEAADYLKVFDEVLRPWWQASVAGVAGTTETEAARASRTQTSLERLHHATQREPLRQTFGATLAMLEELMGRDLEQARAHWRRLVTQLQMLEAQIAFAVDWCDAMAWVRVVERAGFHDVCSVPLAVDAWLIGWHWTAMRPLHDTLDPT